MCRILLIQPASNIMKNRRESKSFLMPMGLCYIASTLIANGYKDVKILDAIAEGFYNEEIFKEDYIRYGLSPDEIKKRIKDFKPDIVGVSCIQSLRKYQSHEVCRLVKEINSKITTVVGGNHHTCFPKETLEDKNIDFVCIGEGEQLFLNLVRWKDNKFSFNELKSIAYREGDKIIIKNERYRENNLDNIPFPANELLDLDKYLEIWKAEGYHYYEGKKFTSSTFARGCVNLCRHCGHNIIFPGYRYRSGKNIADEFEHVYNKFGVEEIQAHEYNSCVVKKQIEDLCHELIKRKLNKVMRWGWPIGIWLKPLTYDFLALMREAGMFYVDLAIEASSQKLLNKTMPGKDVDLTHTQNVIRWANELDYYINCFFMIGFPNQTRQEVENTIEFAKYLDVDAVTFFIAQALPGTEFWNKAIKEGLLPPDYDVFQLRYGKSTMKNIYMTADEIENYRYLGRKVFMDYRKEKYNKEKYNGKRGENFLQKVC